MPYYINADDLAEHISALIRGANFERGVYTANDVLRGLKSRMLGNPQIFCWDSFPVGECNGCRWWQNRYQKCSCCRRNRGLKDNYEEAT